MSRPVTALPDDYPIGLDPADIAQSLYLGLYGQQIDHATLSFVTGFVDLGNPAAVTAWTQSLIASDTFQDSYAASSTEALVRSVYSNFFDRNAQIEEVEQWIDLADAGGVDDVDLPWSILGAARESDLEAYQAKIFIADYFTVQEATGGYVPQDFTRQTLRSNDELYADLAELDESDLLSLEMIGESLEENPLYAATVGTGERNIVFITQQHGDEPTGTEAAMHFLDYLISDQAQEVRDAVTVTVVPRVNPDGFARWEQAIGGVRGLVDPRLNSNGQDLNRTYDPEDPFSIGFAPESVAVRRLVDELDPDLLFDYHGQGNYRDEDGDLDTMSVLWPTNEDVAPEVREASQRAIVAIDASLQEFDYDQLTLYPGSSNPAIGRNGFALRDIPTVLVEQRYGQEMFLLTEGLDLDYSALRSALALEGFISMKGIVEAAADGSLDAYDPQLATLIPERSDSIQYADLYSDDKYVPDDLLVA